MAEKKVLIVDDEIHIVHIVGIKLRNAGFKTINAENGAEAFDLAIREKPDIIVSDLQMPIMTGTEFVEKLRGTENTKDIPVILLIPRHYPISEEYLDLLKVSGTLNKPFSPKALIELVEKFTS